MSQVQDVNLMVQTPTQIQDRISCSTTISEDSKSVEDRADYFEFFEQLSNCQVNIIFQFKIPQPQITSKLVRKALHVFFNICWNYNIALDTLWNALMIFFVFKAQCFIKKTDLEKVIIVCILLSSKLTEPNKLSLDNILAITNSKYSRKQIFLMEQQIIESLNYDLYIKSFITVPLTILQETQLQEFCCLAQLLMLKNFDIFWKKTMINGLIGIIRMIPVEDQEQIRKDLLDQCNTKEGEFILRKYSSKLDTKRLLQKLNKY